MKRTRGGGGMDPSRPVVVETGRLFIPLRQHLAMPSCLTMAAAAARTDATSTTAKKLRMVLVSGMAKRGGEGRGRDK